MVQQSKWSFFSLTQHQLNCLNHHLLQNAETTETAAKTIKPPAIKEEDKGVQQCLYDQFSMAQT